MHEFLITALSIHLPSVMRWAGGMARELRRHNIGLSGKNSGSATTDALTLADLTIQDLLVSASDRAHRITDIERLHDLVDFLSSG